MLNNKGEESRSERPNEVIRTYMAPHASRQVVDATIAFLKKNAQIEKAEEAKK